MDQGLLQVCTVMEFCEHGNLGQLLHKTKQQGERSAPMILRAEEAGLPGQGHRGKGCRAPASRWRSCRVSSPHSRVRWFPGGVIEHKRAVNWMYQLAGACAPVRARRSRLRSCPRAQVRESALATAGDDGGGEACTDYR
jgi:hypothetical protein